MQHRTSHEMQDLTTIVPHASASYRPTTCRPRGTFLHLSFIFVVFGARYKDFMPLLCMGYADARRGVNYLPKGVIHDTTSRRFTLTTRVTMLRDELNTDWPDDARALLSHILRDEHRGRTFAFDFDNTCIQGDIGALFHYTLSVDLAWDLDNVVHQVALEDGQAHLRALVDVWRTQKRGREALFSALMQSFPRRLARTGTRETYGWAATLYAGLSVEDVQQRALAMLLAEREHPVGIERITLHDGTRLAIDRGVRSRPAIATLIAQGSALGIETYIISATTEAVVEVAARDFNVPATHVAGNRGTVRHGVITTERDGPVTVDDGKVEAFRQIANTSTPPILAIGDSHTDLALMRYADHAILIDRGDERLRREAQAAEWPIVPAADLRTVPWGTLHANATIVRSNTRCSRGD